MPDNEVYPWQSNNEVLQDLLVLLNLEALETNLFRGESRDLGGKSVFGGQVLGQAMVAASRTVEAGRPPHSLHGYFLRPGDMEAPIVYEVDRVREGRSFTTRRVQGIQHGKVIFSAIASYHGDEPGFQHGPPMPDVPPPEDLVSQHELRRQWAASRDDIPAKLKQAFCRPLAIDFKPVKARNPLRPDTREPRHPVWIKAADVLPQDEILHRCVLAYASDFGLLPTGLLPHGKTFIDQDMIVASLDHAIWFHSSFRADEWLLYCMESPWAGSARALSRGQIFNRRGDLVASVAQEGLIRHVGHAEESR
ncbi:MAG: acyl-CoA thioesterase II [Salinisphaeraceae bacterium]|nr:acyl-CoA thioesterase II [Salinisphaeraceae bacterium]